MNAEKPIVRHILVALDASPHSLAALQAAVELAAHFGAELRGIFVEDVDLLRMAEMAVVEVGLYSATRRKVTVQEITRHMRVRAREMERAFTVIVEEHRLRGSFRVTRGPIAPELLRAASEADMIVVGKTGWSLVHHHHLGSTAQAIAFAAPTLTLILQHGASLGAPIVVVYDGSKAADKALIVAAALVGNHHTPLTVLIIARDDEQRELLRQRAVAGLHGDCPAFGLCAQILSDVERLSKAVSGQRQGILVLPVDSATLRDESLLTLLCEVDMPVLLVR